MDTKALKSPKLRFPGFDNAWEEKRLGSIAKLTSSKRVYLSDYVDNGIPFYRGKEISELRQGKIPNDILFISQEAYEAFKAKFGAPKKNEILITAVGTLGNVFRIKNNDPFYFKDGNLLWLQEIRENPYFMEILLERSQQELLKSSIGSSQQALTIVGLNKVRLSLPSSDEQQKIAGFLTVVDERIVHVEKRVELLEKYKKGVMQKIFTQQIRFKDENGVDYPGWEEKRLEELAVITTGKKDVNQGNPNGKYPFFTCAREHTYSDSYSFEGEAVMVAGNGEVGLCSYYDGQFEAYQRTYVIQNFKLPAEYIYLYMKEVFQAFAASQKQQGSMPYIKLGTLARFLIPVQSSQEREKIAGFLHSLNKFIENEEERLEKAKTFKKSLLQRMFV